MRDVPFFLAAAAAGALVGLVISAPELAVAGDPPVEAALVRSRPPVSLPAPPPALSEAPPAVPSAPPPPPMTRPAPKRPGQGPILHAPQTVPILTFHDLSPHRERDSILTPLPVFQNLLAALERERFQTFFASEIPDLMAGRSARLKPGWRPVVLTFDDGYKNNHALLLPMLRRRGMRATVFLIVGKVTDELRPGGALTWPQVREMAASGLIEFGSHTYDMHRPLPAFLAASSDPAAALSRVEADLARSRRVLQERLGTDVVSFAWPHGRRSDPLVAAARRAGFSVVLNARHGQNRPGRCSLGDLYRINSSSSWMTSQAMMARLRGVATAAAQKSRAGAKAL